MYVMPWHRVTMMMMVMHIRMARTYKHTLMNGTALNWTTYGAWLLPLPLCTTNVGWMLHALLTA